MKLDMKNPTFDSGALMANIEIRTGLPKPVLPR